MPIHPVAFQSYQSRALPFSAQRLVNLYFEQGPDGAKSPGVLFRRPGMTTFAEVGTGPIRGMHVMRGELFVVSGNRVHTVDRDGVSTELPGDDVIGLSLVDMEDNGSQVAIVTGGEGFIVEDGAVFRITEDAFRTPSSVTFQDAVFVFSEQGSGRIFISQPFEGRTGFDFLDFATAEFAPDDLVRVFSDHDNLFLMGTNTVEPWFGSGNRDFPFAPIQGAVMELGTVAALSVRKVAGNSIMWLGTSERGGLTVWQAQGYTPQRVSTHALESQWETFTNPQNAYALSFRFEGHPFYVLTFPGQGTFVYNAGTGLWSEWQSTGRLDWAVVGFANVHDRRLVGDRTGNKVFSLDVQTNTDDGESIRWSATMPPISTPNNAYARHDFVRIDLAHGRGGDLWLDWSNEDGERFTNRKVRSKGATGEGESRAFWRRLGRARTRIYRVSGSSDAPLSIIGAYVNVTQGRW